MSIISKKVGKIKPSPTFAFAARAEEMRNQGKDIIMLTVGEPDFDTPNHIKAAAVKAINEGKTKYTAIDGINPLKTSIINKFKRDNNLSYNLDQITVGSGGKQVIYNLFMASLDDGDEVIIPSPYWVSYPDIVILSEGVPVIVPCSIETGFKLTPEALSNSITKRTKWLVLNSPSNPTGSAYSKAELAALGEVLKQNPHVNILSDDIYEHQIFEDFKFFNIINACQELYDRTFIASGVSKTYSMTGWRIGYGAGDKTIVKAMKVLQSQSTSNPCSISQYAALEAISGPQGFVKENAIVFEAKRDAALKILSSIDGMECYKPEGAFYIFPSIKKLLNRSTTSGKIISNCSDFTDYLLTEAGVAVVPGIAFGLANHFRISTATSLDTLKEGCRRIKHLCELLKHNP
ncbi:MAG: pyridoxal phosphate-dependent aminotransferase [Rickettsiaceae bacterium]|nr:pyridoxal phosphate-dependent aminotransferase [Rickettsiaceae bacterium]